MEASRTSETSVKFYQTTRRNNPEDNYLQTHRQTGLLHEEFSEDVLFQLAHEAGPKDVGHWKADINHTTSICGDSESILIDASVTEPAPNVRALSLPGYELVPGLGYYKLHIVGKSWQEARKTCEEEGAHLLVIDSEYEAKNMARLWKEYPAFLARNTYYAFIGFHDLGNEGEVVTIFSRYFVFDKNLEIQGVAGFEVFTAVSPKMAVFWVVAACSLEQVYQSFADKSLASTGYDNWDSTENDIRYNCGLFVQKNHKIEIGTCSIARGFFCEHEL
ncbi:Hemolymph lipopolysaccharide-binding protein [Zootermopsis nevadensis]|uniref:Hemolymph lipopolysaccharide-binding protein n=1 Tax=Zootermopsis nevadensis TaxID=136037 RepID=A0A067QT70_ZOONE|nr:Hemolymph lipopolysaccharide-binding protein [Zootermopsis nevadensis]